MVPLHKLQTTTSAHLRCYWGNSDVVALHGSQDTNWTELMMLSENKLVTYADVPRYYVNNPFEQTHPTR